MDYPTKPRRIEPLLRQLAQQYPAITLTGPRQSGKTTLCRAIFHDLPYLNLEPLDRREYARSDPRGLLAEYPDGVILDEVQHAPELTSYLQEAIDRDPSPGRFVLTGSQHFGLTAAVSQSLAGRTAVLHLLPLSLDEIETFGTPVEDLFDVLFTGGYPRIHDRRLDPGRWLADYVATYVERDVRQIANVGDLTAFAQFLQLCAARTGQEINLSALGADAGVSHNTARSWLSIMEASFLVFRAPAWHRNIRKQLIKAPKLHFLDAGLACYLLGIRNGGELRHHPLRGAVFESWVAAEVYKHRAHRGLPAAILHYRQTRGPEIDVLVQEGLNGIACEVKSAATLHPAMLAPLAAVKDRFENLSPPIRLQQRLVYGGKASQNRAGVACIAWRSIHEHDWS
jgi:hypothetical protein